MMNCALVVSVLTMSTAALLRLGGYNDAIAHFNICTLLKYTNPRTHTHTHEHMPSDSHAKRHAYKHTH
jgi:hypothetical protein